MLDEGTYRVTCTARGSGGFMAVLTVRSVGDDEPGTRLDVKAGTSPHEFAASSTTFKVSSRGVYAILVEARGDGLDALDSIVIELAD